MFRYSTSNKLCSNRDVNVQQFLHGKRVALLVAHHGHVVQPVEVREGLNVVLVFNELLRAAVQQPNVRIGPHDNLRETKSSF